MFILSKIWSRKWILIQKSLHFRYLLTNTLAEIHVNSNPDQKSYSSIDSDAIAFELISGNFDIKIIEVNYLKLI